jgi:TatA/E family protein of Tat protein translocase
MFSRIGLPELLLILAVLLLLFGARKIPDLARSLGRSIGEFRRGTRESSDSEEDSADKKHPKPPDEGTPS